MPDSSPDNQTMLAAVRVQFPDLVIQPVELPGGAQAVQATFTLSGSPAERHVTWDPNLPTPMPVPVIGPDGVPVVIDGEIQMTTPEPVINTGELAWDKLVADLYAEFVPPPAGP